MKDTHNLYTTDADGTIYLEPGDAAHSHMIELTLEDRVQIAEADIKALEERVASLEKMLDDQ
jgi:uncharacterized protein YceH (UPF0502 family)